MPELVITVVVRPDDSLRFARQAHPEPLVDLEVFCKRQYLDEAGTVDVIPLGTLLLERIVLGRRDHVVAQIRRVLAEHADELTRRLHVHPCAPRSSTGTVNLGSMALEVDVDTRLGGFPGRRFPVTDSIVPTDGERTQR